MKRYNALAAVLAGVCISIGCVCNLRVGGVAGAVLFAFGLLTIVHYRWPLFTGVAGFFVEAAEEGFVKAGDEELASATSDKRCVLRRRWWAALYTAKPLLCNIIGCGLLAMGMRVGGSMVSPLTGVDLVSAATALTLQRLEFGMGKVFVLAVLCGFIMTTAVRFAREGRFLPLLFGVPVFILCGFLHSIADACYYLLLPADVLAAHAGGLLSLWLMTVAGNFVGCNLHRIASWTVRS